MLRDNNNLSDDAVCNKNQRCLLCFNHDTNLCETDCNRTCEGAGLANTKTNSIIVNRQCSLTFQAQTEILTEKPYLVYIGSVTAKKVDLSKFLILPTVLNVLTCIVEGV